MTPARLRITLVAALACACVLVAATAGTAKRRNPCAAKHEKAGCKLKTATYQGKNLAFRVTGGNGQAQGFAKIQCEGSTVPRNVIYGSYPELIIKNPKIGKTYTRVHPVASPQGQIPIQKGSLKVTITLTSASRATLTYDNQFTETGYNNVPHKCGGKVTETLKRK